MSLENTQCPQCGKGFRFATEHLGSKTRCKNCQAIFVIARSTGETKTHPVQAKPVQAKPVQAKPVQAKPVQAKPVQAKPVQAKPVDEAPLVATIVPASAPNRLVVAAEAVSPYESLAEEMMGGDASMASSSMQRLATVSNSGNAVAYLNTNRQLSRNLKRRDNDWATTFIFRGVNLAIFGLLLFPIAIFGIAGDMWHVTSPLAASAAVLIGFIGCILVVVGFASKPGTAATFGIVPALLFIAGGVLVGKMYSDGWWPKPPTQIAQANPTAPNIGPNFAPNVGNRNPAIPNGNQNADNVLKRLRDEQERDRIERQKQLAERNANRPNGRGNNAGFDDPLKNNQGDPFAEARAMQQKMMKDMQERQREAMEAMRQAAKAPPLPNEFPGFPDQRDAVENPFKMNAPELPNVADNPKPSDNPFEPDDNPFEPDDGASDIGGNENGQVKATPFSDEMDIKRAISFSTGRLIGNGMRKFGSPVNFPKKNSTDALGSTARFGRVLVDNDGEFVIGFLAASSFNRVSIVPVFKREDVAVSVAKQGYALGGFEATYEAEKLTAIRAIYMKIDGNQLDTHDQYFGEWFGDAQATAKAKQITTEGKPAIGMRIWGGSEVQGIALVIE